MSVSTYKFQDEQAKRQRAIDDIAASGIAQLEDKLHERIDRRVLEVVLERNADEAYQRGKNDGIDIGHNRAAGRRVWITLGVAIVSMIIGAGGMRAAMDSTLLTGVAIGRGEAGNEQLKAMEDQR